MRHSILIILLACTSSIFAQVRTLSLDSALQIAYLNNKGLQSVAMQSDYFQLQKKTATEIPKTDIYLTYGQYNSYYANDNNFTISQTIPFPGAFKAKMSLATAQAVGAGLQAAVTKNELAYQIKQVFYKLLFLNRVNQLTMHQDSLYTVLADAINKRYLAGDATLLEKTSAETRMMEIQNKLRHINSEIQVNEILLQTLLGVTYRVTIDKSAAIVHPYINSVDSATILNNPRVAYLKQQIEIAKKQQLVQVAVNLPEIKVGYFNQTLYGTPLDGTSTAIAGSANRFSGFQVGVAVPIWYVPNANMNKMSNVQIQMNELAYENEQEIVWRQYQQAIQEYLFAKQNLEYYQYTASANAELIERQAQLAYLKGAIGLTDYILNLQQADTIKENYALAIHAYNESLLYLEYLIAI